MSPSANSRPAASLAELTPFFKAFCNGTRARIIEQLLAGEVCVCEITAHVKMSQPLISHHLAILRDTGFVRLRGEGARTYYSIDWQQFDEKMSAFTDLVHALRREDAEPSCACG
jgi:DNA-binding transcriptional ArsR family regulator